MEQKLLADYRKDIASMDTEEAKLRDLNAQIKELSFAKGTRDTAKLRDLQIEAKKTANRINIYDQRLMKMEALAPLMRLMNQKKKAAYYSTFQPYLCCTYRNIFYVMLVNSRTLCYDFSIDQTGEASP